MGVDARIVVYARDEKAAQEACAAGFEKMAELDSIMSDYRQNSELMGLCAKAGGPPVKVSPDLFRVLAKAMEVSSRSDGLFDVTISPLVRLWRSARKSGQLPQPAAIAAAQQLVNWRWVHLDAKAQTVQLEKAGMLLDLGAIGKGYCDDEVQKVLRAHGITRALVEMGGDIVVSGPPPGTAGWRIEAPNAAKAAGSTMLVLKNCAISSSGDTEQFVVIAGKKYSHVVNPHTGMALSQGVQSTIIARNGTDADALSTALTLLDEKGRKRLLGHYPGSRSFVRVIPYGS
jgi:thiamine biosynthesis lipoprotein